MDPEIYGVPKTPSNRMLMTDGSGERHSIYHPNRIRFRHRKKANFLYVDGHVAPYTPTTIPAFETSTVGRPVTGPETMDCVLTTW
jgi:prepilin-type processing-associated H-X9-DG protein